jgi:hypothetical protein
MSVNLRSVNLFGVRISILMNKVGLMVAEVLVFWAVAILLIISCLEIPLVQLEGASELS